MSTKIIALGAGHGYNTKGKRITLAGYNGTPEWFLNDRIADMVEEDLKNYNCKVVRLDDTTGKKDISLSKRVSTANNAKADIYISIHHNAGINGSTGGGTVVYYYPSGDNKTNATALYHSIVSRTGLKGNRCLSVASSKSLYVLRKSKMKALLIENGFMDSRTDVPIILSEEHAKKTAKGIVAFLVEQLALDYNKPVAPSKTESATYYKACEKRYSTISTALTSIGVNSTYAFRKKIAKANGISGYVGTAAQNTQMLNLLKAGLLKKA